MIRIEAVNQTIQGFRHVKSGTICEDSSVSFADSAGRYYVAAVADGHGDKNCVRAHIGSKAAVEAAQTEMREFAEQFLSEQQATDGQNAPAESMAARLRHNTKERAALIRQLTDNIITNWRQAVTKDWRENPLTEKEIASVPNYQDEYRAGVNLIHAYGTTLIACLLVGEYLILIQQGDGRCVVLYEDGSAEEPIPWDNLCYEVYTTSMCDENVEEAIRHCVINWKERSVIGCFAGSDGVEDYYGEHNVTARRYFYQKRVCELADLQKEAFEEKMRIVLSEHSKYGSGDDVSIAGIVFRDAAERQRERLKDEVRRFEKAYQLEMKIEQCNRDLNSMTRRHGILQRRVQSGGENIEAAEREQSDRKYNLERLEEEITRREREIFALEADNRQARNESLEVQEFFKGLFYGGFSNAFAHCLNEIGKITGNLGSCLQNKQAELEKGHRQKDKLRAEYEKGKEHVARLREEQAKTEQEFQAYDEQYRRLETGRKQAEEELNRLRGEEKTQQRKSQTTDVPHDVPVLTPSENTEMQDEAATKDDWTLLTDCLRLCTGFRWDENGDQLLGLSRKDFHIPPNTTENIMVKSKLIPQERKSVSINYRYLPPECVISEQEVPDSYVGGRYTLALVLFEMLTGRHPYEKENSSHCYSQQEKRRAYGKDAVFIMDPEDNTNRIDTYWDEYFGIRFAEKWKRMPESVQSLFQRAFGKQAAENPELRPDEHEWARRLIGWRNNMLRCPACEQEFTWKGKRVTVCARCKRKILIPCSLEFQNPVYQQAAFRDSKIFKIQISEENGQEEIAKIRGNAGEPGKWEIENLGQAEWDIITPNGEKQTIPYGGILPVLPGTVIQIGQQQIKIRENDKPEEREDNDTVEHCV